MPYDKIVTCNCLCQKVKAICKKLPCVVDPCFEIGCNVPMIIQETGKIGDGFYAVRSADLPVCLLDGPVPCCLMPVSTALNIKQKYMI